MKPRKWILLPFWECFKTNVIAIAIVITFNVIVIKYIIILFIRNRNRLHLWSNRPMSGMHNSNLGCINVLSIIEPWLFHSWRLTHFQIGVNLGSDGMQRWSCTYNNKSFHRTYIINCSITADFERRKIQDHKLIHPIAHITKDSKISSIAWQQASLNYKSFLHRTQSKKLPRKVCRVRSDSDFPVVSGGLSECARVCKIGTPFLIYALWGKPIFSLRAFIEFWAFVYGFNFFKLLHIIS